jgi:RNA polymerase sigma factor (sigma-70 family)
VGTKTQGKEVIEFSDRGLTRSDGDLLRACRGGDAGAWDELVDRFQRLIYTIPRRAGLTEAQADDVFQEVLLELFRKIDDIREPDRLRAWIVTTAKFKSWGATRGEKHSSSPDTDEERDNEMASIPDTSPLADEVLVELEQQHMIRTALRDLDERCRTILTMIYLRDTAASYADVAAAVGTGETSISPLRARCLAKLGKILK